MTDFPHLLSPLDLGHTTLSCRAIMGSMHTRLETLDRPHERIQRFYEERALGGAALLVTGGYAPNEEGLIEPQGPTLMRSEQVAEHRDIVRAVHDAGGKMVLQILHAGRYAKGDAPVSPSTIASPINPKQPRRMDEADIARTIEDYARCAALAREAGYAGVEVMGSEGYLINTFTAPRTNDRDDNWGGSLENRLRFPAEVLKAVRRAVGHDFIVIYRISSIDLVDGGLTAEEIVAQARAAEAAGASILNQGVGWHEARVPTIAQKVPRGAWTFAARRLKEAVNIPVIASNRINTPDLAEEVLASGAADLVSMARPWLADPAFIAKARQGRASAINVCIACNQACLDYIFSDRVTTCLVNPRAGREIDLDTPPPSAKKRVAVVGAGPAGLSCATTAAARGHDVVLFEAADRIGGQLNLARNVAGKTEFDETLRYYRNEIADHGVTLRLSATPSPDELATSFDDVVVATGATPRRPDIAGIDHPMCMTYAEVLSGKRQAGRRVAIIGAGGIGYDVAEFLLTEKGASADSVPEFLRHWGVDPQTATPGSLAKAPEAPPAREVTMLQRKPGRMGRSLGVSTGWILRLELARAKVQQLSGVTYQRIDDAGVHVTVDGKQRTIPVDSVVICAGQNEERSLQDALAKTGRRVHVIGGAFRSAELDAVRAIDEGMRLALSL